MERCLALQGGLMANISFYQAADKRDINALDQLAREDRLSDEHVTYLKNLDNIDRVVWTADPKKAGNIFRQLYGPEGAALCWQRFFGEDKLWEAKKKEFLVYQCALGSYANELAAGCWPRTNQVLDEFLKKYQKDLEADVHINQMILVIKKNLSDEGIKMRKLISEKYPNFAKYL
jgi:hypothetical protein